MFRQQNWSKTICNLVYCPFSFLLHFFILKGDIIEKKTITWSNKSLQIGIHHNCLYTPLRTKESNPDEKLCSATLELMLLVRHSQINVHTFIHCKVHVMYIFIFFFLLSR